VRGKSAKAKGERARTPARPASAPPPVESLFAGGPERFVERGAFARVLRRLGEPRRAVALPDPAHDYHAVWGRPLPRDLAALARALAAVEIESLGRWRPALSPAFALPARPRDNLVEQIIVADQRDRRGSAIAELLAGALALGDVRGGVRLLYGVYDDDGAAPVWRWQHAGRTLGGPVAGSLSDLAWSAAVAAARRERLLAPAVAQALLARVAPPPPAPRAPTAAAMAQSRWLYLLLRDGDAAAAVAAFAAARRPALGATTLARAPTSVPAALDALWRAYALADRAEILAAHIAACRTSRSRLVRDAARLADELARGRKQLGRLRDLRRLRDQLRAALGRRPAART